MITINNNFQKFKKNFTEDTGLNADQNMQLYIQYVTARCTDYTAQVVHGLTHELLNKLDFMPNKYRLEMADMLRTHEVIKELLKK